MAKTATKSRTAAPKTTKAAAKKTSAKAKPAAVAKSKVKAKAKKATTKSKAKTKPAADESLDLLDETGLRKSTDRRVKKVKPASKRRKAPRRRRQIDPTTCEREYSDQEIQFMHAMDEYKQLSGRMFPTCSEILEVLSNLGYRQIADATAVYDPNADSKSATDDDNGDDLNEVESCI